MSQSQIKNAALSLGSSVFAVDQTADAKALTDDHRVSVLRRAQHSERRGFIRCSWVFIDRDAGSAGDLGCRCQCCIRRRWGRRGMSGSRREYTDAVMLAESMLAEHSHVIEENFTMAGRHAQYEWRVSSWPAP